MDFRKAISNLTDFSLQTAKHILAKGPNNGSNIVFSPSSIHVLLSLIAAGAKGRTLEQMVFFLRAQSSGDLNALSSQLVSLIFSDGTQSGGPCLSFVNGVWVEKSFALKPTFENIASSSYGAVAKLVDFQAQAVEVANEVNSWAEKETNGLIKELLPSGSVDGSTRLILANALYFKGAWNDKFDASKTRDSNFYLTDGSSVQVPFMTSKKKQFLRAFDGFKVLTLPYKQGEDKRRFAMYFFLPDDRNGLQSLVEKLGSESGFIDRHLPLQEVEVGEFRIPKFKISFDFEASEVLKELGLVLPFTGEGDLSEMVDSPHGQDLYVSSIFHKSFIEVNEEGTEAAATSAAVIKLRGLLMDGPIDFVADHPFLFLIREDMTGVVLLIGSVLNPLIPG
ncbi:Serpin family [Cinnamomum micranthum f. kanehirae]|uniref:Serpin family n=1 Tax=Cinnamomum micranthum f. kanehirae TaxID=337451 RepID=A0A443NFM8_9MAGN|nr:Serpin family [Cinnamomum micranthum f. kanehirae]